MGTKQNPGNYDCYANAEPDEPMFILLGRDRHAPALVELWAHRREIAGEDKAKVEEARHCAQSMRDWRVEQGKVPAPEIDLQPASKPPFQARVNEWVIACFGEKIGADREERNHRFIEEALELVQANGCTRSEAHQLVDYVFDRPVGDPDQEVGGVMVTLAALCNASGIDLNAAAECELARVWTKVEQIRAKQAAKPKHSPLPEHQRHAWVKSTLGHGEKMCSKCYITDREAAALGRMDRCDKP